jgi:uncharacterized membrane protein YphA (DoxX/SURF4 family)
MNGLSQTDLWMRAWAVLTARVIIGLIFGMPGFDKVFNLGPAGHAEKYFTGPFGTDYWMPLWMLFAAGVTVPFIELIAGWCMVLGLRVREAAAGLTLVLMLVSYGSLLREPLANLSGNIFPRFILLAIVLFTPRVFDRFSLDAWLAARRGVTRAPAAAAASTAGS